MISHGYFHQLWLVLANDYWFLGVWAPLELALVKKIKKAGAELCQAQAKLDVILEVGMEFGDEVEACHY